MKPAWDGPGGKAGRGWGRARSGGRKNGRTGSFASGPLFPGLERVSPGTSNLTTVREYMAFRGIRTGEAEARRGSLAYGLLEHRVVNRVHGQGDAVGRANLAEKLGDVGFDRPFFNMKNVCDFLV